MILTEDIQGSPTWQTTFVLICCGWLLFSCMRGWINGLLRQLLSIAAVIGSMLIVSWFAEPVATFIHTTIHLSGLPLTALAVLVVWGISYNLIILVGRILFKRTRDQDSGVVRLIYGFGGALIGLIFGLVCIWAFVIGLRLVGHVAENQVHLQQSRSDPAPKWVVNTAKLKNSVELGIGGSLINTVDPLPRGFYQQMDSLCRSVADPQALQKLMNNPGLNRLSPKFADLEHDPEIVAAIQRGDILAIASNPKIIALLNDPELRKSLLRR
jgi:hypothetical protein